MVKHRWCVEQYESTRSATRHHGIPASCKTLTARGPPDGHVRLRVNDLDAAGPFLNIKASRVKCNPVSGATRAKVRIRGQLGGQLWVEAALEKRDLTGSNQSEAVLDA